MSLTQEDLKQIGDLLDERLDEKLGVLRAENEEAHAAIGERIGRLGKRLTGRIDSMAEDVAKIPLIEAEIREINENIAALREHAGI